VGGLATLVDGGNIAGSTLTMDRAFQRAVLEVGLPIEDAVRMASTTPARVLGMDRLLGTVAPGLEADLVVLDDGLEMTAVMAAGTWVPGVIRGGRWPESRPATSEPRRPAVDRSDKRGMKP
jgi:N-acetylglucosamine-6-phosphate deacetylase